MAKKSERDNIDINNGNRFIINVGEGKGVFKRDVDKLYHQYKNLRVSIYFQYKDMLPDAVSRRELMSYIDEQFIRLVKEYDINGSVDFPGYIKTKLNYRVKHSYIKGEYRDRNRVFIPRSDTFIMNVLQSQEAKDEELDYYEAIEYAIKDENYTEQEKVILFLILKELPDSKIVNEFRKIRPDDKISASNLKTLIRRMQNTLRKKLHDSQVL